MCGIVGAAGALYVNEKKVFSQMLIMDQLRGTDSTGVVGVDEKGISSVAKFALNAMDFLDTKRADAVLKANRILIGHNRYATKGATTNRNAHPFDFDSVVGVHNGTLVNQNLLPESHNFQVDSENIYYSFDKIGVEETVKKLHGAYALVWYNKFTQEINFLRNSERPLWLAFTEDHKSLFWASESWMLHAALGRNGVKYLAPWQLEVDTLCTYTVPMAFGSVPGEVEAFRNPVKKKLEVYTPPPITHYGRGNLGSANSNSGNRMVSNIDQRAEVSFSLTAHPKAGRHCAGEIIAPLSLVSNGGSVEVVGINKEMASKFHRGNSYKGRILSTFVRNKEDVHIVTAGSCTELFHVGKTLPTHPATCLYDGKYISRAEWDQLIKKSSHRGNCDWCNSPLLFEDGNAPSPIYQDAIFCPDCALTTEAC